MKRFIRTLSGKFVLIAACVLLMVTLIGSIAGVTVMAWMGFYQDTEEFHIQKLGEPVAQSEAYAFAENVLSKVDNSGTVIATYDDSKIHSNLSFELVGKSDDIIYAKSTSRDVNPKTIPDIKCDYSYHIEENDFKEYVINVYIDENLPEHDNIAFVVRGVHLAYTMRYWAFMIVFASLVLFLVLFVPLMHVSARRPDSEELYPGPLNGVPFDILVIVAIMLLSFLGTVALIAYNSGFGLFVGAGSIILVSVCLIILGVAMSAAARLKQRTLFRNTLIYKLVSASGRGLSMIFSSIPIAPKIFIAVTIFVMSELAILMFVRRVEVLMIIMLIRVIIYVPFILYVASTLKKLFKGTKALAMGDLGHKIDTSSMRFLPSIRSHAEDLNQIADGMNVAVEERLKSERLKTELITNVSHDIKTPLTSIINYAGLVASEKSDNPKITEYSEVLVRQSERLKRLIEDLVEASKASSGNLEVAPVPCDASVFVTQAQGEYEDKLKQTNLTLVTSIPENKVTIMADGRRMWRIFDNLMNNICKYAQSGTRVYLSLEECDGHAEFVFKNTSAAPLNMSEEELMERFTRGDKSRNSGIEGNGLGLSIARSMAELQGGTLNICIDGDLFKAVLRFPVAG